MLKHCIMLVCIFSFFLISCDSDALENQKISDEGLKWEKEPSYQLTIDPIKDEVTHVNMSWGTNKFNAYHRLTVNYSDKVFSHTVVSGLNFSQNYSIDYSIKDKDNPFANYIAKEVTVFVKFENDSISKTLKIKR